MSHLLSDFRNSLRLLHIFDSLLTHTFSLALRSE